jgi:hypothetical protein
MMAETKPARKATARKKPKPAAKRKAATAKTKATTTVKRKAATAKRKTATKAKAKATTAKRKAATAKSKATTTVKRKAATAKRKATTTKRKAAAGAKKTTASARGRAKAGARKPKAKAAKAKSKARQPRAARGGRGDISSDVITSIEDGQRAAIEAVRRFADSVERTLPQRAQRRDGPPTEVIDSALEMADRLVQAQHDFLQRVVQSAGRTLRESARRG